MVLLVLAACGNDRLVTAPVAHASPDVTVATLSPLPEIAPTLPAAPEAPPTQPPPPMATPTSFETGVVVPTQVPPPPPPPPADIAATDDLRFTPWTPTALPLPPPTAAPTTPPPRATPLPPLPEGAPEVIVDDRDPGFSTLGAWYEGDGGSSYASGCHWSPPGMNIAYVKPDLPAVGSYDVFAWGCGDPNHDQAWQTEIMVYPYRSGRYAPPTAYVNLKEDPGRWVPVGTYYMTPGGSLSIKTPYYGNIAVDAFRFVFRSPESITLTPEPIRTTALPADQPPSPQEQLVSGDLSARLGLVQRGYQYTPAFAWEEVTLDDCAAFPREECGGQRDAWQTRVEYRGRESFSVPYRVSKDLWHVSLDAPEQLKARQLLYLFGQNLTRVFYVYRYPLEQSEAGESLDSAWWQLITTNTATGSGSAGGLTPEQDTVLRALVEAYASIGTGAERITTADGWDLRLYGLGKKVALDAGDRAQLEELGSALGAQALP